MNEIEEAKKKTNPKYYEDRIVKLQRRAENIDGKIEKLRAMKKEIEAEISHCKDEQILAVVKRSRMSFEEINNSIEIAFLMQKSGLSKVDVEELVKTPAQSNSLNYGGSPND